MAAPGNFLLPSCSPEGLQQVLLREATPPSPPGYRGEEETRSIVETIVKATVQTTVKMTWKRPPKRRGDPCKD